MRGAVRYKIWEFNFDNFSIEVAVWKFLARHKAVVLQKIGFWNTILLASYKYMHKHFAWSDLPSISIQHIDAVAIFLKYICVYTYMKKSVECEWCVNLQNTRSNYSQHRRLKNGWCCTRYNSHCRTYCWNGWRLWVYLSFSSIHRISQCLWYRTVTINM